MGMECPTWSKDEGKYVFEQGINTKSYDKLLKLLYTFEKFGDETELEEWNKIILKVQDLKSRSKLR